MRGRPAGALPRLMLVTDRRRARGRDLVQIVGEATRGGVGLVQVRESDLRDDELRELIARIADAVPAETTIVVNRSVRVARTTRCGLHLPAGEPPLGSSGHGPGLYGRSVHDDDELRVALDDGVDYVLAGTVFPTESKPGRRPGGPALIERLCRLAHPTPVFAIGGVTVARVPAAIHSGAHGVAVCGALVGSNDPRRVAEAFSLALEVATRSG